MSGQVITGRFGPAKLGSSHSCGVCDGRSTITDVHDDDQRKPGKGRHTPRQRHLRKPLRQANQPYVFLAPSGRNACVMSCGRIADKSGRSTVAIGPVHLPLCMQCASAGVEVLSWLDRMMDKVESWKNGRESN